jgi:hypothetical protein
MIFTNRMRQGSFYKDADVYKLKLSPSTRKSTHFVHQMLQYKKWMKKSTCQCWWFFLNSDADCINMAWSDRCGHLDMAVVENVAKMNKKNDVMQWRLRNRMTETTKWNESRNMIMRRGWLPQLHDRLCSRAFVILFSVSWGPKPNPCCSNTREVNTRVRWDRSTPANRLLADTCPPPSTIITYEADKWRPVGSTQCVVSNERRGVVD